MGTDQIRFFNLCQSVPSVSSVCHLRQQLIADSYHGGISLWFRVDDIDATYQRLLDLGATSRYAPVTKPFGDRLASVYDPDGNLIGISQRKEKMNE